MVHVVVVGTFPLKVYINKLLLSNFWFSSPTNPFPRYILRSNFSFPFALPCPFNESPAQKSITSPRGGLATVVPSKELRVQ